MSRTRTPRYANIHLLTDLPFSNPNRDDTGAPKTATYGDVLRGRMSSQALKRPARLDFEGRSGADLTHRSKYASRRLAEKVHTLLAEAGTSLDEKAKAKLDQSIAKEIGKLTGDSDDAKATLVWLAEAELNELAVKIAGKAGAEMDRADVDAVLSQQTDSLTIALFGRMFANRADLTMEAAVQFGHAITTHEQQVDLDYFTAFDDLQASYDTPDTDGKVKGAGAGHLDVNEFTSGIFYRHIAIARDDLAANWAPLADPPADRAEIVDRLAAVVDSLLSTVPQGRASTASHDTPPRYVMVTFTPRPTSYAPAFETPVAASDQGGYARPSVDALAAYADKALRYVGEDQRIVFDLDDPDTLTFDTLVEKVATWLADVPRPSTPDAEQVTGAA